MLLSILVLAIPLVAQESDDIRLRNYLQSLQLNRLVIAQLEQQVSGELDGTTRLNLARQLSDRYVDALLDPKTESKMAERMMAKVEGLRDVYPSLANPQLSLAILQAKYLSAEKQFRHWWPTKSGETREHMAARWQQLERELFQFRANTQQQYQELVTTIQVNGNDVGLSKKMTQTENLLAQSSYLSGWITYFNGVLESDATGRRQWLQESNDHFRNFLQLDAKTLLTEFSSKWFDFNSAWQVQALVGLAMGQRGLNHSQQCQHCFDLIREHGSRRWQLWLDVWELDSRGFLQQDQAALDFVAYYEQRRITNSVNSAAFWPAVLDVSVEMKTRSPSVSAALRRSALAGLARTERVSQIEKFLAEQNETLPDDFYGFWLRGFLLFHHSEQRSDRSQLKSAHRILETAIQQAGPQVSEFELAYPRLLLAKIDFRLANYSRASERAAPVATVLLTSDRQSAAEAQWLVARSLLEVSRTNSRQTETAYAALETLIRQFPDSPFVPLAEFEKLRLKLAVLPGDEAIVQLKKISSADPQYEAAVLEIARLRFQLWLTAFESRNVEYKSRFAELSAAVNVARSLNSLSAEKKLNATLLLIDARLRSESLDDADKVLLNQTFDQAAEYLTSLPSESLDSIIKFRYYQMLRAEKLKEFDELQLHARWIVEHGKESAYESAALIQLGRFWEAEHEISDRENKELQQQGLTIFRRLVEVLGMTTDQLQVSKNAQVATAKLAELEMKSGEFENARRLYARLVDSFPNQQPYVHGLASVSSKLNDFSTALPLWHKISLSATPGSEIWYESKFQMIRCLLETDRAAAETLYRQTLRLSPDLPEPWRMRFHELEIEKQK